MKEVLIALGWTQQPPEGGGAVRERWESLAALLSVAEDLEAGTSVSTDGSEQPVTLGDDFGRVGPARRGATYPGRAGRHGLHAALGKGLGVGRGGAVGHSRGVDAVRPRQFGRADR